MLLHFRDGQRASLPGHFLFITALALSSLAASTRCQAATTEISSISTPSTTTNNLSFTSNEPFTFRLMTPTWLPDNPELTTSCLDLSVRGTYSMSGSELFNLRGWGQSQVVPNPNGTYLGNIRVTATLVNRCNVALAGTLTIVFQHSVNEHQTGTATVRVSGPAPANCSASVQNVVDIGAINGLSEDVQHPIISNTSGVGELTFKPSAYNESGGSLSGDGSSTVSYDVPAATWNAASGEWQGSLGDYALRVIKPAITTPAGLYKGYLNVTLGCL